MRLPILIESKGSGFGVYGFDVCGVGFDMTYIIFLPAAWAFVGVSFCFRFETSYFRFETAIRVLRVRVRGLPDALACAVGV